MTISASTFTYVADLVLRTSAVQLAGKEYLVETRLRSLIAEAQVSGVDEYVDTLRKRPYGADHDRVVEALTTNETSWFRDITCFQTLTEDVVPALMRDRPGLPSLRVWSAACSSGQEPYSIVMALQESAPDLRVEVISTDISQAMLRRARAGRYSQIEVNRGLPAGLLVKHFTRAGTGWEISAKARSKVTFVRHNLLDIPPVGGWFDIVFLRNTLIYFSPETRSQVLQRVRSVLRPGGFLLLGAAESTLGVQGEWERELFSRGTVLRSVTKGAA